ncbi:hypothetical protein WICPIJ_000987 [Wickerhamomyces pijperi]|uniref:Uncharacterized protein n=1 Tax=Wickerhamomyces pijperi TaxID=599730 RepID=A0A9P8TQC4_WICPI|nr:hypothetical protein WICPIJ_000987 [Wickerhamomyces pijperi]
MTRLILPSTDQQSHTLFDNIDIGGSDDQEQDVDVFISTQVQGRMDEFEEDDDCQQRATSLFAKFKNTANDGDNKRKHTVSKLVKAKHNESNAKTTAKTKTKTKQVRRKRTVPPKSITETMLRKFSGKQGKISQLIRSSSKSRAKDGDNQRPMTIQELTRAKYVLTFKPQVTHSQFHQPPLIEDSKSLWHTSSSQPQGFTPQDRYDLTVNQRDENSVVKFRDAMKITKPFSFRKEQSEVEHEQDDGNFHYLTLSQIIGVRSKSVRMDQDQANDDDDAFDYTKLPQYHDPNSFDINQLIDDTDDSHFHDDLDEIIPCSEDEGETLTLKLSSVGCLGGMKKNRFTCDDQIYNDECVECSEDEFGICYR